MQDTYKAAEVVLCYRATRALLYMWLAKLKQANAAEPPAGVAPQPDIAWLQLWAVCC